MRRRKKKEKEKEKEGYGVDLEDANTYCLLQEWVTNQKDACLSDMYCTYSQTLGTPLTHLFINFFLHLLGNSYLFIHSHIFILLIFINLFIHSSIHSFTNSCISLLINRTGSVYSTWEHLPNDKALPISLSYIRPCS